MEWNGKRLLAGWPYYYLPIYLICSTYLPTYRTINWPANQPTHLKKGKVKGCFY